jgi:uncharacterized membrane protein YsdA (DUF1294 family)/cold shock CspA family protein
LGFLGFKRIENMTTQYQGTVTTWKDEQGFGFITPNNGMEKVFFHISAFKNSCRPTEGDPITYELEIDKQRRFRANNVKLINEKIKSVTNSSRYETFSTVFAVLFCLFVIVMVFIKNLPFLVPIFYVVASFVTFIAYAIDKSAARKNRWRTKESTLHLFSLMGGWLGALFAQKVLSHKSRKQEFKRVFWITVILNCSMLGWIVKERDLAFMSQVVALEYIDKNFNQSDFERFSQQTKKTIKSLAQAAISQTGDSN